MPRAAKIAKRIERTVTGPMWHGPALVDVLDGVQHDRAAAKPIAGAHSIWEIVLHVTAWAEIARLRVAGQATEDPTPEQDWPPAPAADPAAWRLAVERMGEAHRQLATDARRLDDEKLDAPVPGLKYSVSTLLHGIVEHGTYHGGQIALLKKA
jgi:uncharacterized damage-inducible protein DinB